jgi:hypothetical protein
VSLAEIVHGSCGPRPVVSGARRGHACSPAVRFFIFRCRTSKLHPLFSRGNAHGTSRLCTKVNQGTIEIGADFHGHAKAQSAGRSVLLIFAIDKSIARGGTPMSFDFAPGRRRRWHSARSRVTVRSGRVPIRALARRLCGPQRAVLCPRCAEGGFRRRVDLGDFSAGAPHSRRRHSAGGSGAVRSGSAPAVKLRNGARLAFHARCLGPLSRRIGPGGRSRAMCAPPREARVNGALYGPRSCGGSAAVLSDRCVNLIFQGAAAWGLRASHQVNELTERPPAHHTRRLKVSHCTGPVHVALCWQ